MSNYNWTRFWCKITGNISLIDDGFLYDPDSEYGRIYNPDVVPFTEISNTPCLALIGEPGIGKSFSMKLERESIDVKLHEKGEKTIWIDLRSYSSETRLIENLFNNQIFKTCIKEKNDLHIFLDSLDECLLRINTISNIMLEEFAKYPK